jgi:hypothetical protein
MISIDCDAGGLLHQRAHASKSGEAVRWLVIVAQSPRQNLDLT